jgi:hypothetical protein
MTPWMKMLERWGGWLTGVVVMGLHLLAVAGVVTAVIGFRRQEAMLVWIGAALVAPAVLAVIGILVTAVVVYLRWPGGSR